MRYMVYGDVIIIIVYRAKRVAGFKGKACMAYRGLYGDAWV